MSRYAQAVEALLPRLDLQSPGIGILVVPPTQHGLVAEALGAHLREAASAPLDSSLVQSGPVVLLATGIPQEREQAAAVLAELNGRRGWVAASGRLIILLLTRHELAELQRHAGDVYSGRLFLETVPFVPDPSINPDEARAELARWQRERFGRLDLRGFIRSESEDVAWRIEDIYQQVKASIVSADVRWETQRALAPEASPVHWLEIARAELPQGGKLAVILGHPGSGKTFFLRWAATAAAREEQFCGIQRPLPLLASLSAYAQSPGPLSLYDFFVETLLDAGLRAAHVLERMVEAGRALFLLDGLDEVGDEGSRQRMRDSVRELSRRASDCLVVITSRMTGYEADSLPALEMSVSPFADEDINQFLTRWCELYACERLGDTPAARKQGTEEGSKLARDVLQHEEVSALAHNPLLLTVLALVHRAGVRLPDHRVELYEHATRILVERWNRVRGLAQSEMALPLKVADAVRLLGPVALETIRAGTRGAIEEDTLRQLLQRSLVSGNLRGLTSADEAISLFRNSLGLLVEQGPGLYSFLHLTLAEYFAARELVRSKELEHLIEKNAQVFKPEWREVLLLAAGELGINRVDDARLEALVDALLERASKLARSTPATVPSLIAGLLADDPGLSVQSASKLLDALIPGLWFASNYESNDALFMVLIEASSLVQERLGRGRYARDLRERLETCYGMGVPGIVLKKLEASGSIALGGFTRFLMIAGIDYGPACIQYLRLAGKDHHDALRQTPFMIFRMAGAAKAQIHVSQSLDRWARSHAPRLKLRIIMFGRNKEEVIADSVLIPWERTHPLEGSSKNEALLEFDEPVLVKDNLKFFPAFALIEPTSGQGSA